MVGGVKRLLITDIERRSKEELIYQREQGLERTKKRKIHEVSELEAEKGGVSIFFSNFLALYSG